MNRITQGMTETIGATPLVQYNTSDQERLRARLLMKVEGRNPGGSVKDRPAAYMVQQAEQAGELTPGSTIIEPTSGNTGIGLAWIGAAKGYRVVLSMPESMTEERKKLLRALGAELILTPAAEGMKGAIAKAEALLAERPGAWMARQFDNPNNPEAHLRTTGPEIWEAAAGQVDAFVAGVGTGGTLTGVGRFLRAQQPQVQIFAVEPAASPVLSGGAPGPHPIAGIGAGFVPRNLDLSLVEEILQVTGEAAMAAARDLRDRQGLLVGISAGAALHAAKEVASRPEMQGKTVVVVLPDGGERYLSTPLFEA